MRLLFDDWKLKFKKTYKTPVAVTAAVAPIASH